MPEPTELEMLRDVVRWRFVSGASNAIVMALEGMDYLTGVDSSSVTAESLRAEYDAWKVAHA